MVFANRRGAGRQLGLRLAQKCANRDDVIVLALPRGGLPIGLEVAAAIDAPLDVFVDYLIDEQSHELIRREQLYRGDRPPLSVKGKTAIVVDDGLATGATMRAAIRALRSQEASRIVVAVPVGSAEAVALLRKEADDVICLSTPAHFRAVGVWYVDFPQVTDEEVRQALEQAAERVSIVT